MPGNRNRPGRTPDAPEPAEKSAPPPKTARRLGAALMWFAVLGGITAWVVHLMLAWGAVELACVVEPPLESNTLLGLSLRDFALVATAVPLVVALVALVASGRFYISQFADVDDAEQARARFMIQLGLGLNILSVLMIAFGGIAVLWFQPCIT